VFVGDVECIHTRACASNTFNGVLNSNSSFPLSYSNLSLHSRRHKLILTTCVSLLHVSIDIQFYVMFRKLECSEHNRAPYLSDTRWEHTIFTFDLMSVTLILYHLFRIWWRNCWCAHSDESCLCCSLLASVTSQTIFMSVIVYSVYAGTLLLCCWSFKRILKENVNYVRRYQQMSWVSGTNIMLRRSCSMIYHEFHRQIQYKFSSSTNEQNRVPLPTKDIAGLNITLILFSCLLINYFNS